MKKVLLSIMVIMGLTAQVSCTNESEDVRFSNSETLVEETGMSEEDVELIKLQNEIADLNARTFPEVPYTRGGDGGNGCVYLFLMQLVDCLGISLEVLSVLVLVLLPVQPMQPLMK